MATAPSRYRRGGVSAETYSEEDATTYVKKVRVRIEPLTHKPTAFDRIDLSTSVARASDFGSTTEPIVFGSMSSYHVRRPTSTRRKSTFIINPHHKIARF
jgi:hypothetical protein